MPSQQAEILETIHALKRALRREKEAPTDQPITSATNRGNKLKKGATYVHAGALPYPHGPNGYKQPIEHAGYTRYILERNPRRYNEYGDELEDSESDPEADADAEDENAYGGVQLEELLCPLKHPSELATHPTLSIPFLDSALHDMVQTTEEKLRQERASLWRAKHLHRQLIGDESWMPCGAIETKDDWDLFEPRPKAEELIKKRKRLEEQAPVQNGIVEQDPAEAVNGTETAEGDNEYQDDPVTQSHSQTQAGGGKQSAAMQQEEPGTSAKPTDATDVEMQDTEPMTNGAHDEQNSNDRLAQPDAGEPDTNGETSQPQPDGDAANTAASSPKSTPPPPRRITRALAAEANPTSNAATPPAISPSPTISTITSDLLTPDPLFLLPSHVHRPHPSIPLPVDELIETRRLLTLYIQKQEETIRSTEAVLGKLIRAKRMRGQVLEWCKAEGHVGEWSDGEDWIDAEYWGEREDDLKKGKDEEEGGVGGHGGDDEGGGVGIQGGGRKGKRRRRERE